MTDTAHQLIHRLARGALIVAAFGAAWFIHQTSALAGLFLLTDGLLAGGIVLGATGLGLVLIAPLDRDRTWPVRWHVGLGLGLGVGLIALLVLISGCCGLLSRPLWLGALGVGGVAGALRAVALSKRPRETQPPALPWGLITLIGLLPSITWILLVATTPPGVLWAEEARGYDVLEYHLQVPKEHAVAGNISYLSHNIYSNFPSNAEMLYLLSMVVRGATIEAAILAKLVNALLALGFIYAAWLGGREFSRPAGCVAALAAGTAPWLMYLSGVAYVENGLLLCGMLCVAVLCRVQAHWDAPQRRTWIPLAGALAGLACGFKYTAVPLIAAAGGVGLIVLCVRRTTLREGMTLTLLYTVAAGATWAAWPIKNTVMTGNPVFPLAHDVFGARDGVWTDELAERWHDGHRPAAEESTLAARLQMAQQRIVLDPRLGALFGVLALPLIATTRRSRIDAALLAILVVQFLTWLLATHLYARFAVPLLIPMSLLCARAASVWTAPPLRALFTCGILAASVLNLRAARAQFNAELTIDHEHIDIYGRTDLFYRDCLATANPATYVRSCMPPDGRLLMVGEARAFYMPSKTDYCVVFNRNPFAEAVAAAQSPQDVMTWLRDHGYTHVLVSWTEMSRLRSTYGFWPELDDALFERLESAGLERLQEFERFSTVYAVPSTGG